MKRILPLSLIAAVVLTACERETVPVESVELNISEISVLEGKTQQLSATVNPSSASVVKTEWESSDESIADVEADGLLRAVMEGTATITVRVLGADGSSATSSCIVNVIRAVPNITALTMNVDSYTLGVSGKVQLLVTTTPSNASTQDIVWSSSAPKVAKVSASGLVTAVASGKATITASTPDGRVQATCAITVR